MPPQRRKTGPVGPPRRRPKVAGASRVRPESDIEAENPDAQNPDAQKTEPQNPEPQNPGTRDPEAARAEQRPVATPAPQPEPTPPTATPVDLGKSSGDRSERPAKAGVPAASETPVAEAPVADEPEAGAPEAGDPEADDIAEHDRRPGRNRWRPVVVVGAVAFVLAAFAVVAAFRPGAPASNEAWVDQAATTEVTEAAAHAIETMHGYNFETIEEDFAQIRELLTPERREEFDSTANVTKDAAVQTRTVTEVDVVHIGASMLDGSQAEVAAFINVSATGDGIAQGSAAAPLLVRMEKSDGRWLVSEIRDR